jgi:hypothetical protein
MATIVSSSIPVPGIADPALPTRIRPRHISPEAGRALRILGHAIEYLANEFLHDVVPPSTRNPRLQAVQLLLDLNREVYAECPEEPETPTLRERCRRFLSRR